MRSPITVFVVVVSCGLLADLQARAEWVPVLEGSIARVAASSSYVAAVRGGEVWILREDGTPLTRLAENAPFTGSVAGEASTHLRQAETILDLAGVSESDRDSDWAIDLLEDERTRAQRLAARERPTPGQVSPATPAELAASRAELWIAHGQHWFRVDADGRVIRPTRGGVTHAWAAADRQLLVALGDGLALLAAGGEAERFVALPSPADKVALSASGRGWAWSGPMGTRWSDGTGTDGLPFGGAAVSLAYCGETLLVLLPDVLLTVAPGKAPEVRARDLQAHRLLCPATGAAPWLALGRQLSVSFDDGRTWAAVATPPGHRLLDVAATGHHLWLATEAGLYMSAPAGAAGPPLSSFLHRPRRRRPNPWWSWLPQVSVRAATATGIGDRAFEALAFAQFALDRPVARLVASATEAGAESPSPSHPVALPDPDWPCLGRARRKAVEAAMAEPARAKSYVTRAGRAAWLPELRVLVSRRYGRSESLDLAGSSTALSSPLGIDTVNDIRYEARATWDLAKLVFSTEELAAQNQALHMAELRRDIENTMNRLYFERRRLALASGSSGGTHALRADEIEAEMDALSAGAFGACLAERPPLMPAEPR